MWDDPPVRRRADQPGEEFPDVRRYHQWDDLEGPQEAPEPPEPVHEPPKPALRVVPDPEPVDIETVAFETPPEDKPISLGAGLRLLARQLAERLDRGGDE